MARQERTRTGFPGVFGVVVEGDDGKPENQWYIRYRRGGREFEEPVGRSRRDNMSPAEASIIRRRRMRGEESTGKEQREAEKKAEKEARRDRMTFDTLFDLYAESKAGTRKRGNMAKDANLYKNHVGPALGSKEPKDVVALDIDRIRHKMLKGTARLPGRPRKKDDGKREGYAVATVNKVTRLIKVLANFGADRELCEGLRIKIKTLPGENERTEDMTVGEMKIYIKTCEDWADRQAGEFQLFLFLTGMRRGEARELKWESVNVDRGAITVRKRKGGKDVTIPMSSAVRELLDRQERVEGNPYVFPGERGEGPRGIRQIADTSRAIRDAVGLPKDWRPNHGLRHTLGSHLASSGKVDLFVIQKLLGHATAGMTQRYSHLRDEALRRGAEIMADVTRREDAG